jgi:thiazole/oxazole-forming peptide maturase SagD family component
VGYPVADGPSFCWPDSNGNAAGNNLEEAILQGFLELVERDSIAVWWYSRLERPGVDLGSFHEPYFLELSDHYRWKHREFWVLDVTGDLGIPAFVALSRRVDRPPQQITMGYGAHLDPRIATLRAVTELNQANWQCRFFEDGPYVACDDAVQDVWFRTATLAGEPYLAPSRNLPVRSAADFPDLSHGDLRDDVLSCVEIARRRGLETLVLDQTRPDIGMSVVKVIVPGLRHWLPRFAAGRLIDVPVRMGWLSAPLQEIDLNPTPMVA